MIMNAYIRVHSLFSSRNLLRVPYYYCSLSMPLKNQCGFYEQILLPKMFSLSLVGLDIDRIAKQHHYYYYFFIAI